MEAKKLNTLPLCSLAVAICVLSQGAFAHVGVKDTITEGTTTTYNAMTITHGCTSNTASEETLGLPVIATSVLFPNSASAIVNKVDASGIAIEPIALDTVITGTLEGAFTNLSIGAVYPSIFDRLQLIKDDLDNVRGFQSWGGNIGLPDHAVGLAPFRMSGISFQPDTAGSINCAKSLLIRVAAADWCLRNHVNDTNDARVDVWIGHMTTLFNDPETMAYSADDMAAGKFHWPKVTVNRDETLHPLDPSCNGGFDVAVEPSDAEIDAYLPFPATTQSAPFWPAPQP